MYDDQKTVMDNIWNLYCKVQECKKTGETFIPSREEMGTLEIALMIAGDF